MRPTHTSFITGPGAPYPMAHAFDAHSLGQCLRDAEALVRRARDQEVRLGHLESVLEAEAGASSLSADVAASAVAGRLAADALAPGGLLDLVKSVRELTSDARDQRLRAEAMLGRLVGAGTMSGQERRSRVLIVDDSENSRDTTATILDDAGFDVMTATNGLEGVIAAHYLLPAVILMDVTMPVLDGLEAARLIRLSQPTQHLKIVAYTAKLDISEGPFARWFDDVLGKPSNPDAIVKSLRQLIAHAP